MRILVLGGDGFLGWPLVLALARRYPDARITWVDNLARRRQVDEFGGRSITPIASPEERQGALSDRAGRGRTEFVSLDVATPALDELVASVVPTHVYHLAQQASAPYSMADVNRAVFTVHNNEVGNLRLLFAVRHHAPEAHVIKLGSFGEYARAGIDVAEGYFVPTFRGAVASRPMPYPREADDIYHASKINDSNFASMACRKWGLAITDVMQTTIVGAGTPDTLAEPTLHTRLDCDAVFGTVVHRFVAQAVLGLPMTVYGSGFQRTGLMPLADAVESLAGLASTAPLLGRHRVINHVTEQPLTINELVQSVCDVARERGIDASVDRDFDPRYEDVARTPPFAVDTGHVHERVRPTPMRKVVASLFEEIARHRDRVDAAVLAPRIRW